MIISYYKFLSYKKRKSYISFYIWCISYTSIFQEPVYSTINSKKTTVYDNFYHTQKRSDKMKIKTDFNNPEDFRRLEHLKKITSRNKFRLVICINLHNVLYMKQSINYRQQCYIQACFHGLCACSNLYDI